jgi:hypothetical protein
MHTKKLSVIVLGLSMTLGNAFAAQLPDFCKSLIYAKVDKKLPSHEFLTDIQPTIKKNVYTLELTKDMGDENYCLKAGEVIVDIPEGSLDVCDIKKITISRDHYDCG